MTSHHDRENSSWLPLKENGSPSDWHKLKARTMVFSTREWEKNLKVKKIKSEEIFPRQFIAGNYFSVFRIILPPRFLWREI